MPVYVMRCPRGHEYDVVRGIAHRDDVEPCPFCPEEARRDLVASMRPYVDMGFQRPLLSRSLGVNPAQINEARRRFPHHNFAPDGRMIVSSAREYDRVQRDLEG